MDGVHTKVTKDGGHSSVLVWDDRLVARVELTRAARTHKVRDLVVHVRPEIALAKVIVCRIAATMTAFVVSFDHE